MLIKHINRHSDTHIRHADALYRMSKHDTSEPVRPWAFDLVDDTDTTPKVTTADRLVAGEVIVSSGFYRGPSVFQPPKMAKVIGLTDGDDSIEELMGAITGSSRRGLLIA